MATRPFTQHRFILPSGAADGAAPVQQERALDIFTVSGLPRAFVRELALVLPDVKIDDHFRLICTCLKTSVDLVSTGADAAAEKDACLEIFNDVASAFRARLMATLDDVFVDFVDPCSGLAVHTSGARVVFPEVDAMESLLRFRTSNAGCCKVLLHPQWGSYVYPASIFVRAACPDADVTRAFTDVLRERFGSRESEVVAS